MLATRIIPCLDVRDGVVVKGVRFEDLRQIGDPAELAARYEREGADEVFFLDVSATIEGRSTFLPAVAGIRERLGIPLACGGGVSTLEDARLLLLAGADKVSVNTAAARNPRIVGEIAGRYGSQCAVVAIDAAERGDGGWDVWIESGWTNSGLDAEEWAAEAARLGAGEILLTSRDRDGTREGYDLALIRAVAKASGLPVVASGGARGPRDFEAAVRAGASAVLAASMFHDGDWSVVDAKKYLSGRGLAVRT